MESGMVSVDRWIAGSQVYFLTHIHADHVRGLTPKWTRGPLYCSRITAKLFPIKFPGFDFSLIRIVEIGHWHSVSLLSSSSGAVMYLFRGEFGCTLYTGDFRWESTSERAQTGKTTLLKAMEDVKLDMLFLDNTYCNPTYCFPSREVAAKQVLSIISSHPNHDIIIAVDTLEKENLLLWHTNITTPNGDPLTAGRCDQYIYTVLYSDHSCLPELQKFVEFLKPININGIVSSTASYVDPLYHFGSLCRIQQASELLCQRLKSKRYEKIGVTDTKSPFGHQYNAIREEKEKFLVQVLKSFHCV
ncbi:uncharacterized protein LOC132619496 [Lycium barbarum]|uniref:uncharacterized protein LOC132619496 n=1 Tax=Lycium barbarum TaxID=112863 RepID=UPI00293F5B7F|nr:uncharacterized protein LOC132619496 [Lycium barbarum]